VFAFPLGVGALEVFYAVGFEVPESCGYFVDQVVVERDGVSGARSRIWSARRGRGRSRDSRSGDRRYERWKMALRILRMVVRPE
jgi:hypothetical protein